ncbi:MAG: hypothetical protein KDA66_14985, partial [Planctomycetaceae bacterium]|nr:hypothetical protein [Planctomycetaceae bacterium]
MRTRFRPMHLSTTAHLFNFVCLCGLTVPCNAQNANSDLTPTPFETGQFQWRVQQPFLKVDAERLPESVEHPWVSVKDPSIVRFGGKWHLFCTLRKLKEGDGRIRIGCLSFENWEDAQRQDWSVLTLTMSYHGAPQIFWFEPHQKWYL